ncbi:claudin-4-like [Eleginops maclovinus]|uniref:claudin-4-like n=1 Tax=Eleginops maclovinus TaxID=56733 RepID=UPI00308051D6
MAGQCMQIGGLTLVLIGVLGVCLTCGLPMWRQTSVVGAKSQLVWDGLWVTCIHQVTGQKECSRHTSSTKTADIRAGRALTLISIFISELGFVITLFGGGKTNCSDATLPTNSSFRKKVCLLGGGLCVLAGVLCLASVSWSAVATISTFRGPSVTATMKTEVGSSIYIGWASSMLLLLGGAVICCVCGERNQSPYSNAESSTNTQSHSSYEIQSDFSRVFDASATHHECINIYYTGLLGIMLI